jgi:UDP-glucose 4-epimerase
MNILVTGGAGFIGSHLSKHLVSNSHKVTIVDNFKSGSISNLSGFGNDIEIISGDIRDEVLVSNLVLRSDIIFHLAANLGVKQILKSPTESVSVNIFGSEVVLRFAAKYGKRIVIASTSEIYGKNEHQPLSENADRLIGRPQNFRWAYSDSKAIEEAIASFLFETESLPVTTVRLFNTVGPRQNLEYGMVLPAFIDKAIKNQDLEVFGAGDQTRTFCHVMDVVEALIKIIENSNTIGEVFNIGGEGEISMLNLAQKVITQLKSTSKITIVPYEQAYVNGFEDMKRRVPDLTKIKSYLNWSPKFSLEQIITDIELSLK